MLRLSRGRRPRAIAHHSSGCGVHPYTQCMGPSHQAICEHDSEPQSRSPLNDNSCHPSHAQLKPVTRPRPALHTSPKPGVTSSPPSPYSPHTPGDPSASGAGVRTSDSITGPYRPAVTQTSLSSSRMRPLGAQHSRQQHMHRRFPQKNCNTMLRSSTASRSSASVSRIPLHQR